MSAFQSAHAFADRSRIWPFEDDRTGLSSRPTGGLVLRLVNLSPSGFDADDNSALECDDIILLDLPGLGSVSARVMSRGNGRIKGRFQGRYDLRLHFLNGLYRDEGAHYVEASRSL